MLGSVLYLTYVYHCKTAIHDILYGIVQMC